MENELYILFLENRLKEVKLLHTNEVDEVDKLKAENERLKKGFGHGVLVELEQVDSLKDEVKELKAENKQLTQTIKYSNGNDGLYDEIVESNEYLEDQIKDLKAELSKFQSGNAKEYVDKLKADNVKLFKKLNDANKQIIAERVNR